MKRASFLSALLVTGLVTFAAGCGGDESDGTSSESSDQVAGLEEGSPAALSVLAMVNDRAIDAAAFGAGKVASRAAKNILAHRDGADAAVRTADDDLFDTIAELDAVSQVGTAALRKLKTMAEAKGYLAAQNAKERFVVFSPQPAADAHTAHVAEAIRGARRTIDVAMYSYSDAAIGTALAEAVARGVKVRFLFETAGEDKKLTGSALTSSKSGRLEAAGVDVRYVNKIMHHKFTIIDGPREDLAFASEGQLITGSGNWSSGAGTKYDENTIFLKAYPELNLRFQREFDHLWAHSRDLVSNPAITSSTTTLPIDDAAIAEDTGSHVTFTSENFDVTTDTFKGNGGNAVADVLVAAIANAEERILVASGHLRHRGVSEALIARKAEEPELDIRVYLDGQEYISEATHAQQLADLDACLAAATTDAKRRTCMDKGFLFGLQVGQAGIDVRYKYYAYRWNASYAPQMHNKVLIVDDQLFTGSYNLSDNAEHETFENMLHFKGPEFLDLVGDYAEKFESLWVTGEGQLEGLRSKMDTDATIPLVFPAMSLSWQEVRDLKSLIAAECPKANSLEFRQNPTGNQFCTK